MEKKDLICIVCPKGCHLKITEDQDGFHVTGNGCKRGPVYAKKELTNPTRVLTTTVKIKHAVHDRLPVVTDGEIPKGSLMKAMQVINHLEVEAPVAGDQVILKDILGFGVNVIASKGMNKI
ncbi:DUF1667 domain-containing protein [Blautia liquoris]|mgnify:CR=1 FL=1|uniref:DUF1667 domain-containing protein n=1 Tax=Blautia liquoris TaxID=2779518 RepID=A0A7M2RE38_9FIRM|nr:DUF1667 domain-containing protein [Blautia liquoris]QOV18408.1 DUF1667 domain-containing protein [Blautia liquoris]